MHQRRAYAALFVVWWQGLNRMDPMHGINNQGTLGRQKKSGRKIDVCAHLSLPNDESKRWANIKAYAIKRMWMGVCYSKVVKVDFLEFEKKRAVEPRRDNGVPFERWHFKSVKIREMVKNVNEISNIHDGPMCIGVTKWINLIITTKNKSFYWLSKVYVLWLAKEK